MQENSTEPLPDKRPIWRWAPIAVFFFALAIRLVGIGWGLPNDLHHQSYHPDEQPIFAFSRGIEPAKLDLVPGVYNYGTLYLTGLRVASDMVAAYSGSPTPENPDSLWQYQRRCHLAGRILSALAGALLAVFIALIAKAASTDFGGLIAGLAASVAPGLIVHSRFQTSDMVATALFAASLWLSVKLLSSDDDRAIFKLAVWAGVLAGLSAGTKYTGVIAFLSLPAALYIHKSFNIRNVAVPFAAMLLSFCLATPGVVLDWAGFSRDFAYEALHTSTGHGLLFEQVGSGFIYHLGNLGTGLSALGFLFGLSGFVWAIFRKVSWAIVLLPSFIAYYILIGRADVLFLRYTFPLMIALCVGIGWLVAEGHSRKGASLGLVAVGFFALGSMAMQSALWTGAMVSEDPRDTAAKFIKERTQTDPSATVGLVSDPWYYTPPLTPNTAIMRGMIDFQVEEMKASAHPRVITFGMNQTDRYDWDIRLFGLMPQYIVYSSFESGDLERLAATKTDKSDVQLQVDRFVAFQKMLRKDYSVFTVPLGRESTRSNIVHDMQYVAPVIYIWKRK